MSYPFLALQPAGLTAADEWVRLGFESHQQGKLGEAERQYTRALGLEPNHPIATNNLGLVHVGAGMVHLGLLDLERAALFAPDHPVIQANRAFVLLAGDRPLEAIEVARKALSLACPNPMDDAVDRAGYILSRQALATALSATGRADAAAPLHAEALSLNATNFGSGIASCFLPTLRDVGPEQYLPPRAAWRAAHGFKGAVWPHNNRRDPERPLRVGYVSGDFKTHSAAMIFSHVILNHTPAITPYFYSTISGNPAADAMCLRLMMAAGRVKEDDDDGPPVVVEGDHRWRDISAVSNEDADDLIRKDGIDILVDLSGHTNGNRLALFTRRPAPVACTAWGFAVGTGLPEIDAFFADPITVPESEREHYAETVVYLPSIVTYRPPDEYGFPGASPLPYYRNEYVTFGCFGRFEKMGDSYFAAVREILGRTPNSRAYFKDAGFRKPDHIRRVREALGVDHARLLFGMATPHIDHIQAYQACDLFLDTFPHGMGQTVLEATYMGVPAVTLYGKAPPGRLAASVYTAIGRGNWITRTKAEYVEKAVAFAADPAALALPRKTLRRELVESPVVAGYPAAVESAYRWLWRQYCLKGGD